MKSENLLARRKIIFQMMGSTASFFIGSRIYHSLKKLRFKPQKLLYTSYYRLNLNHLNPELFSDYQTNIQSCPFRDLILPHLDNSWINNYNLVRQYFINNRSMLSGKKIFSPDKMQITFITEWSSPEAFWAYHEASNMNFLDKKFHEAGCRPYLKIAPQSFLT